MFGNTPVVSQRLIYCSVVPGRRLESYRRSDALQFLQIITTLNSGKCNYVMELYMLPMKDTSAKDDTNLRLM